METASNASRKDPAIRSALKELQLARLALKQKVADGEAETTTYSEAYASQPEQVALRESQEAAVAARRSAKAAVHDAVTNSANSAAEVFKKEGGS